jgi:hypothetical protein
VVSVKRMRKNVRKWHKQLSVSVCRLRINPKYPLKMFTLRTAEKNFYLTKTDGSKQKLVHVFDVFTTKHYIIFIILQAARGPFKNVRLSL